MTVAAARGADGPRRSALRLGRSSFDSMWRLWLICAGLALVGFAELSYANFVQPLFEYTGMVYDPEIRSQVLPLLLATVAVSLACMSARLKPGHLFTLVVFVFVFLSTFTVAPHFLGWDVFQPMALVLAVSMLIIAAGSNIELPFNPRGAPRFFWPLFWAALGFCAMPLLLTAVLNGVKLPGFAQIYELRDGLRLNAATGYGMHLYTFAVGPLAIAVALRERSRLLLIAAGAIYVLCYAISFQKTLILAPAVVVAAYAIVTFVKTPRPWMFLFLYAMPLLLALFIAAYSDTWSPYATGYVLHRMYAMPGQIFAHYADFFSYNPHTWFSHVNGVNWFVRYPYDLPLPLLIGDAYPGGNQNASFWTHDGIAGAGLAAIPVLSVVFVMVLAAINTAVRGLDPRFAIPALTMSAQRFSDGSLPTALLSGGLMFLIIMLWLAPRGET